MLLQGFQQFILKENLFTPSDTVLLAVSAGIDSVALCELFHQSGYPFAMAHCNFGLRGEDSDADEQFVVKLGKRYGVPVFCKHFKEEMRRHKDSTQVAARKFRYEWFFGLLEKQDFTYLATAHHLDDQVETFFINLLRGSGLSGLHGILPKKGRLIRPLLFCERIDIEKFAKENQLEWREDSSNATDKYLRNKLRHHVLPAGKSIDSAFSKKVGATLERIRQSEAIYQLLLEEKFSQSIVFQENIVKIDKKKLFEFLPNETFVFELLRRWDFHFAVCQEVFRSLDSHPGKIFYSETHQLLLDRDFLILTERSERQAENYWIDKNDQTLEQPLFLQFSTVPVAQFTLKKEKTVACVDFDKLKFPLQLRRWEQGDWFIPLGMQGKKKVSDFFIDQKLSLFEKENVWVLCSGDQIVWVVGMRLDDRFKISSHTQTVFELNLLST